MYFNINLQIFNSSNKHFTYLKSCCSYLNGIKEFSSFNLTLTAMTNEEDYSVRGSYSARVNLSAEQYVRFKKSDR